ncbi:hypothetical protein HDU88_002938 [Geranomyces variabilis]|nr:hypothetical protein HDU88_002938 [Geranomyces variabilis]
MSTHDWQQTNNAGGPSYAERDSEEESDDGQTEDEGELYQSNLVPEYFRNYYAHERTPFEPNNEYDDNDAAGEIEVDQVLNEDTLFEPGPHDYIYHPVNKDVDLPSLVKKFHDAIHRADTAEKLQKFTQRLKARTGPAIVNGASARDKVRYECATLAEIVDAPVPFQDALEKIADGFTQTRRYLVVELLMCPKGDIVGLNYSNEERPFTCNAMLATRALLPKAPKKDNFKHKDHKDHTHHAEPQNPKDPRDQFERTDVIQLVLEAVWYCRRLLPTDATTKIAQRCGEENNLEEDTEADGNKERSLTELFNALCAILMETCNVEIVNVHPHGTLAATCCGMPSFFKQYLQPSFAALKTPALHPAFVLYLLQRTEISRNDRRAFVAMYLLHDLQHQWQWYVKRKDDCLGFSNALAEPQLPPDDLALEAAQIAFTVCNARAKFFADDLHHYLSFKSFDRKAIIQLLNSQLFRYVRAMLHLAPTIKAEHEREKKHTDKTLTVAEQGSICKHLEMSLGFEDLTPELVSAAQKEMLDCTRRFRNLAYGFGKVFARFGHASSRIDTGPVGIFARDAGIAAQQLTAEATPNAYWRRCILMAPRSITEKSATIYEYLVLAEFTNVTKHGEPTGRARVLAKRQKNHGSMSYIRPKRQQSGLPSATIETPVITQPPAELALHARIFFGCLAAVFEDGNMLLMTQDDPDKDDPDKDKNPEHPIDRRIFSGLRWQGPAPNPASIQSKHEFTTPRHIKRPHKRTLPEVDPFELFVCAAVLPSPAKQKDHLFKLDVNDAKVVMSKGPWHRVDDPDPTTPLGGSEEEQRLAKYKAFTKKKKVEFEKKKRPEPSQEDIELEQRRQEIFDALAPERNRLLVTQKRLPTVKEATQPFEKDKGRIKPTVNHCEECVVTLNPALNLRFVQSSKAHSQFYNHARFAHASMKVVIDTINSAIIHAIPTSTPVSTSQSTLEESLEAVYTCEDPDELVGLVLYALEAGFDHFRCTEKEFVAELLKAAATFRSDKDKKASRTLTQLLLLRAWIKEENGDALLKPSTSTIWQHGLAKLLDYLELTDSDSDALNEILENSATAHDLRTAIASPNAMKLFKETSGEHIKEPNRLHSTDNASVTATGVPLDLLLFVVQRTSIVPLELQVRVDPSDDRAHGVPPINVPLHGLPRGLPTQAVSIINGVFDGHGQTDAPVRAYDYTMVGKYVKEKNKVLVKTDGLTAIIDFLVAKIGKVNDDNTKASTATAEGNTSAVQGPDDKDHQPHSKDVEDENDEALSEKTPLDTVLDELSTYQEKFFWRVFCAQKYHKTAERTDLAACFARKQGIMRLKQGQNIQLSEDLLFLSEAKGPHLDAVHSGIYGPIDSGKPKSKCYISQRLPKQAFDLAHANLRSWTTRHKHKDIEFGFHSRFFPSGNLEWCAPARAVMPFRLLLETDNITFHVKPYHKRWDKTYKAQPVKWRQGFFPENERRLNVSAITAGRERFTDSIKTSWVLVRQWGSTDNMIAGDVLFCKMDTFDEADTRWRAILPIKLYNDPKTAAPVGVATAEQLAALPPGEEGCCICGKLKHGRTVQCGNLPCNQWSHYLCANLVHKPRGEWFCCKPHQEQGAIPKYKAPTQNQEWSDLKAMRFLEWQDADLQKWDFDPDCDHPNLRTFHPSPYIYIRRSRVPTPQVSEHVLRVAAADPGSRPLLSLKPVHNKEEYEMGRDLEQFISSREKKIARLQSDVDKLIGKGTRGRLVPVLRIQQQIASLRNGLSSPNTVAQIYALRNALETVEADYEKARAEFRRTDVAVRDLASKQAKLQRDVKNQIDAVHSAVARFITAGCNVLLLPTFDFAQITRRRDKGPQGIVKHTFSRVSHSKLFKLLRKLFDQEGGGLVVVDEAFSTKACCQCGIAKLGTLESAEDAIINIVSLD